MEVDHPLIAQQHLLMVDDCFDTSQFQWAGHIRSCGSTALIVLLKKQAEEGAETTISSEGRKEKREENRGSVEFYFCLVSATRRSVVISEPVRVDLKDCNFITLLNDNNSSHSSNEGTTCAAVVCSRQKELHVTFLDTTGTLTVVTLLSLEKLLPSLKKLVLVSCNSTGGNQIVLLLKGELEEGLSSTLVFAELQGASLIATRSIPVVHK